MTYNTRKYKLGQAVAKKITFHLNKWLTDWRFGPKCMDCMPIASCMSLNIPCSVSQFPPYLVHLQVIQALLSQGIITHAQYMSLMYMKSVVCILFSIFRCLFTGFPPVTVLSHVTVFAHETAMPVGWLRNLPIS